MTDPTPAAAERTERGPAPAVPAQARAVEKAAGRHDPGPEEQYAGAAVVDPWDEQPGVADSAGAGDPH
ncbi:hypothetical protein [Actinoplanes teichomyceticus]|uniref:Uncharacterized protein n=1 Tax=Actinoplanes teichomyceticus TaxID=1867 RepID=A0A561VSR0_ACTTI|nr:hypothetical protein [Actinoplanes teichomyceticus]TWG14641.1 hypothetical protein FHX34_104947 [Actinoplanes teichomyceticus]GIF10044.1 hypothetical protein Ate01nite_00760 [Actinoplanes teichomyceticus]